MFLGAAVWAPPENAVVPTDDIFNRFLMPKVVSIFLSKNDFFTVASNQSKDYVVPF